MDDNISTPFVPVSCDYYVTESTFGIPVFQWEPQSKVIHDINQWWADNAAQNIPSIITAYSLGKAQRVIHNVDHTIGPVYTHGAVHNVNKAILASGVPLKESELLSDQSKNEINRSLIVCPPGAADSAWSKKIKNHSLAMASGWMGLRGARRRRNADKGFILSDHADWKGLNKSIEWSGAHTVYVTHGYTDIFSKWLQEKGITSQTVETAYEGETLEPV